MTAAASAVALRTPFALCGAVRTLTRSSISKNVSQPAPASSSQNPHAARVAAASSSSSSSGRSDARSRLAKLQAQRLEELNRGRGSGSGGAGGGTNKPEQRWSNRTLIALATSVGACTYLMGTYHGYNAGKEYAVEQAQLNAGAAPVVAGEGAAPPPVPRASGVAVLPRSAAQASTLSAALLQLLPFSGSVHCEPQPAPPKPKCRLAELTQYHCDLHSNRVVCQPIDRIFRM